MSLERERAIVTYDPSLVTVKGMAAAIQRSVLLPRLRQAVACALPRVR